MRPKLVVLLPRGEAVRNIIFTKVSRMLMEHADVTIIGVAPNDEVRRSITTDCHEFIELKRTDEGYGVRVLREILETAHQAWLLSEAAKHRWEKRMAEAVEWRRKAKLTLKRLLALPFAKQRGLKLLEAVEGFCTVRTAGARDWGEFFLRKDTILVFNASHVHGVPVRSLLAGAKKARVRTMAFVFSWDNLTSQGRIIPQYDSYAVWSDGIREELQRIYPEAANATIHVTGTPQFDFHFRADNRWTRAEFCERLGLDPNRPIVLYTTGMANHMPYEDEIVEFLADRLRGEGESLGAQLVLRVYAKDRTGRFERLFAERRDITRAPVFWEQDYLTPLPEDEAWYLNTLLHCDVGVNVASTVSLELCIHDKPVINIGFDPPGRDIRPLSYARFYKYDHYKPVVESGAVEIVWNSEDLIPAIRHAIFHGTARREARRRLMQERFRHCLDGQAALRLVQAILSEMNGPDKHKTTRGGRFQQ